MPSPTRTESSVKAFMEALCERFCRESGETLLLLFDEADEFLKRDALNSTRATFAESSRLKSLMETSDHAIKGVFAGLHNVVRTTTQSNHPLAHMGQPIRIGPLVSPKERGHANDLLRGPLEACGHGFEPDRLSLGILANTNYYPSLIQIYGAEILSRLSEATGTGLSPTSPITRELLDSVRRSRELREQVQQRFEWTLPLDPRYGLIDYWMASQWRYDEQTAIKGIGILAIHREVRKWSEEAFPKVAGYWNHFIAILDEMVELGVLRKTGEDRYSLRNPNILALLGGEEQILNKLEDLEAIPLQPTLGPAEIRRRAGRKGATQRPLTLSQERLITVGPRKRPQNGVVVVAGLSATGIKNVGIFLEASYGAGEVAISKARSLVGFRGELRGFLKARHHKSFESTMLIVPDGWDREYIKSAIDHLRRLRSRSKYARVVFVCGPEQLLSLLKFIETSTDGGQVELISLQPWDNEFAARWLDEDNVVGPQLSAKGVRDLAERLRGWPALLELILGSIRSGANSSELLRESGLVSTIAEHRKKLWSEFGLHLRKMAPSLRFLADHGIASLETLLETLRDPESHALVGDDLSTEELEESLRAALRLHLISETDDAEWQVDPAVKMILDSSVN